MVAPTNNCLIVGAGRSGTSLTGLLLARAGYHVYGNTHPPDEGNPLGYFEDVDVNAANDAILAPFYCSAWRRFSRMLKRKPYVKSTGAWLLDLAPRELESISLRPEHVDKFRKLFARTPFAYKDPRFSFTLGALAALIPKNTFHLCVFRDPLQVVESSRKHALRSGVDVDDKYCFAVWEAHYRCLFEHRRKLGGQWLFISYQQLIDGVAVLRMEEFLKIRLDRTLVKPELNRAKAYGMLPDSVAQLYEQLLELSNLEVNTDLGTDDVIPKKDAVRSTSPQQILRGQHG
jgi:hypothetical protein